MSDSKRKISKFYFRLINTILICILCFLFSLENKEFTNIFYSHSTTHIESNRTSNSTTDNNLANHSYEEHSSHDCLIISVFTYLLPKSTAEFSFYQEIIFYSNFRFWQPSKLRFIFT